MTKPDLTSEAERVLFVMYELAGGKAGVVVSRQAILERFNELGLATMSVADFESHKLRVRQALATKVEAS